MPIVDELESLLVSEAGEAQREFLDGAVARARRLEQLAGGDEPAATLAGVTLAAETLSGLWVERAWTPAEIDELLGQLAPILNRSRDFVATAVFLRTLDEPPLLELPPRLGVEARLGMLLAFSPVDEASLWTSSSGRLECLLHVGSARASRRARDVAKRALTRGDGAIGHSRSLLHALPVRRWQELHAALVIRAPAAGRERAVTLAAEVARTLGAALEGEALLARNAERERSLVEWGERRLVRVGFDLHDGPMQDVVGVVNEMRHFREQVGEVLAADDRRDRVLGRFDDLDARLRALDRGLRDIAQSLNSAVAVRVPFEELVEREVHSFEQQHGTRAAVTTSGGFERLTQSQRIALLRLVQEALSNVQHHSRAENVRVAVSAGRRRIELEIEDDGDGFDVETTLFDAARAGRLGLVGMSERIRLLGGRFDITSAPGGPTRIAASLPYWPPPDQAATS